MVLEMKQPIMEKIIEQDDNLIIQENKIEIKKNQKKTEKKGRTIF